MEKYAERVRLDQSVIARARIEARYDGKDRAGERADQADKREKVAALYEGLQQHRQRTESAPGDFGGHAVQIFGGRKCGTGKHLAGYAPFHGNLWGQRRSDHRDWRDCQWRCGMSVWPV